MALQTTSPIDYDINLTLYVKYDNLYGPRPVAGSPYPGATEYYTYKRIYILSVFPLRVPVLIPIIFN